MITTYTVPGWITWRTFQTQSVATHWTGHGTLEDPWIIAPADDIWGWFVREDPARYPHTVVMTLEYTQSHHALMTTVTVVTEPITPPAQRNKPH